MRWTRTLANIQEKHLEAAPLFASGDAASRHPSPSEILNCYSTGASAAVGALRVSVSAALAFGRARGQMPLRFSPLCSNCTLQISPVGGRCYRFRFIANRQSLIVIVQTFPLHVQISTSPDAIQIAAKEPAAESVPAGTLSPEICRGALPGASCRCRKPSFFEMARSTFPAIGRPCANRAERSRETKTANFVLSDLPLRRAPVPVPVPGQRARWDQRKNNMLESLDRIPRSI
jgi:hypothetical protein